VSRNCQHLVTLLAGSGLSDSEFVPSVIHKSIPEPKFRAKELRLIEAVGRPIYLLSLPLHAVREITELNCDEQPSLQMHLHIAALP
jgi:hypothetical protein